MTLEEIIYWCNRNSGFIMALLTLIYVIVTLAICLLSYVSAKTGKRQTEEMRRQYADEKKGMIHAYIVNSGNGYMRLKLKNIGKSAVNFRVKLSEDWVNSQGDYIKNLYNIISSAELIFAPEQEQLITLGNQDTINTLVQAPLTITIQYADETIESITYDLNLYSALFTTATDYYSIQDKRLNELKDIKESIDNLIKKEGIKTSSGSSDIK